MGSKATGCSSLKLFDSLRGKLVELPGGNVSFNLRIPLGRLERGEPLAENRQVIATQLLYGMFE